MYNKVQIYIDFKTPINLPVHFEKNQQIRYARLHQISVRCNLNTGLKY